MGTILEYMNNFDLIVIGGGPAGLMAAGQAAELGSSVLLLEKNHNLGVKLLMTGGGRCNFTNKIPPRTLADAFGANGKWLLSGLTRFGSNEVISFFKSKGLKVKVEANGRVFPESDNANDLLTLLLEHAKKNGVTIRTGSSVLRLEDDNGRIQSVVLRDGTTLRANKYIIATGGRSYPTSGSTGDAYDWLRALAHRVIKPRPALSPILLNDDIKELQGISLSEIELRLFQGDKKLGSAIGDIIFTGSGLSGPAALNISRVIARHPGVELEVRIDFLPLVNQQVLEQNILALTQENKNHDLKNIISELVPKKLAIHLLSVAGINSDKKGNGLSKAERQALARTLKSYAVSVKGLRGFEEAMITVGGVDLREVDPKTMGSKLFNNLYFAGEILDLEGPTGGYNLQVAWTSGYIAGENAAKA
ncbi:aminoacetone oxidase family FAD-binding enzyme [Candidatus Falkowbacteria bacterium HGW-Falkowbacteria-2]|uniref:Aminoacetone oxidase family FAD-binding enzyme n=1 Tax=Candidatus Falkowbacteria bacterium HGW-Falkowbacteria-2 TaxID=2013769 RepID=A0A2N2E3B1_9BACT|nr:MAG: aminoacetone oxidase family FAD-binding enzyme [Candidatus Falkowbacteria bacterium HGW-Falkowbacteria-2]